MKYISLCTAVFLTVLSCSLFAAAPAELSNVQINKAVVNMGNTSRFQTAFFKAKIGKPLDIAIIGTALAASSGSSSWDNSLDGLIMKALYKAYPYSSYNFIDLGMYMGEPQQGAALLTSHLINKNPDISIISYSENDAYSKEAYEGIIRQCLAKGSAVICITSPFNSKAEAEQIELAKYYNITAISLAEALKESIADGTIDVAADLQTDKKQPNDTVYSYIAQVIIKKIINAKFSGGKKYTMPSPLVSDTFQYADFISPGNIRPVDNKGFRLRTDPNTWGPYDAYKKMWVANDADSKLIYEFEGTGCGLIIKKRAADGGFLKVSIDNKTPILVNCSYPDGWDVWEKVDLAYNLPAGKHTISFSVSDEIPEDSTDTYTQICGIMIFGTNK